MIILRVVMWVVVSILALVFGLLGKFNVEW